MTTTTSADASATALDGRSNRPRGVAASNTRRLLGAIAGITLLVILCALSLFVGAKTISPDVVWQSLFVDVPSGDQVIVTDMRLPRTVLGLLVGAGLAVAGGLIQAMTRNPLADPGILGVNAGSAFFVALAVGVLGAASFWSQLWAGMLGAAVVSVVVYGLGSLSRTGPSPIHLTLSGVAISALLTGVTTGLILIDPDAFDHLRAWRAGSIAGRDFSVILTIVPFVVAGLALALAVSRSLNAMSLGDDAARALGAKVGATRAVGATAVMLLCGASTAAAGPISFVGLMIPHVCRWIVGPDQRWILVYSAIGGANLVLAADIVGRLVLRPGEMEVGVVTAFIGAPVLIFLVRRARASGL